MDPVKIIHRKSPHRLHHVLLHQCDACACAVPNPWQASCRITETFSFLAVDYFQSLFKDRRDAGQRLASALMHLKEDDPVVLALPRGGVPVGHEVAKTLNAPLDVLIVRKIGAPVSSELGLGAVVDGDPPRSVLNDRLIDHINPPPGYIEAEIERQISEIARRRQLYCGNRRRIDPSGRTVILVDDGAATGSTMKAALRVLADAGPERLVFALPVAPRETYESLLDDADEGICLLTPERFRAVSLYYAKFGQTSDEEVCALLNAAEPAAEDDAGKARKKRTPSLDPASESRTEQAPASKPINQPGEPEP